jgi:uncharacterized Fe-S cluster-containing radical SAM superfamily protein
MEESPAGGVRSDFFESRVAGDSTLDWAALRAELATIVEHERSKTSDPCAREEYGLVLAYLADPEEHDSEGRDLKFSKKSFSRTELRTARSYEERLIPHYLRYRVRFDRYPRNYVEAQFPIVLAIEPTSICNLRCIMCFQSDRNFSENKAFMGHMDFGLFTRIIDEGKSYGLASIVLASRGEPLLHQRIVDMVRYAKENGVLDVKLNTNAVFLSEVMSRGLLRAGVDTLVFSVDSADKEEFERIRVHANFEKIVHNIETFKKIRTEEFPGSKTRTRVSMVILGKDQQIEQAGDFWASRVDEFAVKGFHELTGLYQAAEFPREQELRPCSFLWERLYIWWDGTVNPCGEDYLSSLAVGKLDSTTSLYDLWHSPRMREYREAHLHEDRHCMTLCRRCAGY